jgi:hypothetical protein
MYLRRVYLREPIKKFPVIRMEELIREFEKSLSEGDRRLSEGDYGSAYESYLNALFILATAVVYKETGMLVPPNKLPGFLGAYPRLIEALERYPGLNADGNSAMALRNELEEMKTLLRD